MPASGLVHCVPTSVDSESGVPTISSNGTVTFTTNTSNVTLNGVFTSDYDNYMIVIRPVAIGSSFDLLARLSSAGTPATGSDYFYQECVTSGVTITGTRSTATTSWRIGSIGTADGNSITIFLFAPFLSGTTGYRSIANNETPAGYDYGGFHNQATSYDGIRILAASTTIDFTGTIIVYGFNQ